MLFTFVLFSFRSYFSLGVVFTRFNFVLLSFSVFGLVPDFIFYLLWVLLLSFFVSSVSFTFPISHYVSCHIFLSHVCLTVVLSLCITVIFTFVSRNFTSLIIIQIGGRGREGRGMGGDRRGREKEEWNMGGIGAGGG